MKVLIKLLELLISLVNILCINIYLLKQKVINKKKIIFFYHPKENLTKIHDYYLREIVKRNSFYQVIFASKVLSLNHFYIKEILLKYILFVDIFVSNNVSNNFTKNSKRLYLHHDIYDTPLVGRGVESDLKKRLVRYNAILLPSKKSQYIFEKIFKNQPNQPTFIYLNSYPKLNVLAKKIRLSKKKLNTIIIAPTNFKSFKSLTIINYIDVLIAGLLKLNYKVIYRPHPSNINHDNVIKVFNKFSKNKKFIFDMSVNYLKIYQASDIMITDMSGTAYTFALLTKKPVIFFSRNEREIVKSYYSELNFFKDRNKIGRVFFDIKAILYFFDKKYKNYQFKQQKKNIKNIFQTNFGSKKNVFDVINSMF